MARVLVTGGCGFIGANLVPQLRGAGHAITIIDDFSRGDSAYLDDPAAYRIVRADIRDGEAVRGAAAGMDAVVHLAAYGSVVDSVADPTANFSVNVEGTFSVLKAAREAGVKRVVFSSTGGALFGECAPPVNEESLPTPISPYGASKLAGEGYCRAFARSYELSVTALRFANVVGPVSWHKKGAVTSFFKAIMAGNPIRIFGNGSATRDFLYVGDLCRGILQALDAPLSGFNVFHLASGREISVKELAATACRVAGSPEHPVEFDSKRRGEVERNFASFALAEKNLGFRPRVGLEEALKSTWDWLKSYAASHPGAA